MHRNYDCGNSGSGFHCNCVTKKSETWVRNICLTWTRYLCLHVQVLDKVPTISIDKTDGCQMYLSAKSLDVEIVSSKSSEMNVMVPKGDGDFVSTVQICLTVAMAHLFESYVGVQFASNGTSCLPEWPGFDLFSFR